MKTKAARNQTEKDIRQKKRKTLQQQSKIVQT